jgi:hypothetical protein
MLREISWNLPHTVYPSFRGCSEVLGALLVRCDKPSVMSLRHLWSLAAKHTPCPFTIQAHDEADPLPSTPVTSNCSPATSSSSESSTPAPVVKLTTDGTVRHSVYNTRWQLLLTWRHKSFLQLLPHFRSQLRKLCHETDLVCPPGLHITLGIFYRFWTLLETACHELDLELATRTSPRPTDQKSFQHYSALVKQLAELNEKKTVPLELTSAQNSWLADLAIQIPDAESHTLVQMLKEEALSSARKLDDIDQ